MNRFWLTLIIFVLFALFNGFYILNCSFNLDGINSPLIFIAIGIVCLYLDSPRNGILQNENMPGWLRMIRTVTTFTGISWTIQANQSGHMLPAPSTTWRLLHTLLALLLTTESYKEGVLRWQKFRLTRRKIVISSILYVVNQFN